MRGRAVFLTFFTVFASASLAVPVPLFPGNIVHSWFATPSAGYGSLITALTNGALYGFIVWLVFVLVAKRLEEQQLVS